MPLTFGGPHRHFRVTDSTNARARELATTGAPGGTVVTAGEQTAGRGRQGRAWIAPPGKALLYSAILRPFDESHFLLPLAVPLAVCETAEALQPGVECRIKWPNDIWVDGRKLAGVLIETSPQEAWAVIGVGLNLAIEPGELPPELRETATSLAVAATAAPTEDTAPGAAAASGAPPRTDAAQDALFSPQRARVALDSRLGKWVEAEPERVLASYRERDTLCGREITWSTRPGLDAGPDALSGSGIAGGIDDRGGLVVLLPGGGRAVLSAGEVHLRL